MHIWYNCRVKYLKVNENGKERKVSETYLIEAISFSEAEGIVLNKLAPFTKNQLEITTLAKTNISEVFDFEDDGLWYKTKISYTDVNEETEKAQKFNKYILVSAKDIKQAYERIEDNFQLTIAYDIISVQDSGILDVFPYEFAHETLDEHEALESSDKYEEPSEYESYNENKEDERNL